MFIYNINNCKLMFADGFKMNVKHDESIPLLTSKTLFRNEDYVDFI